MGILDKDRKLLWGRSGNRCAMCKRELVEETRGVDAAAIIGEECHIVAQSPRGPRGGVPQAHQIDAYENLILLCRNHHRIVDAQPRTYPTDLLRRLKTTHELDVQRSLAWLEPPAAPPQHPSVGEPHSLPSDARSEELFSRRLADAFPGVRGLFEATDPVVSLDRLDIVFRPPIHQLLGEAGKAKRVVHPFWWFGGGMNLQVESYRRLDPITCLLGSMELRIARVAAFRAMAGALRDFLYVETVAMPPSGAYSVGAEDIASRRSGQVSGHFVSEEYGLWNNRVITREEYDDGAAMIDGQPVRVHGAELRLRYLTPVNMLLCGNRHVINDVAVDLAVTDILDGLLRGERRLSDLTTFVEALRTPSRMQAMVGRGRTARRGHVGRHAGFSRHRAQVCSAARTV